MKNHKVVRLLQEGFRFETLKMLNESQINTLYGKVILEQNASITDATKKAKEELAGLNQAVDSIAKKIASEQDNIEDDNALGDLAMQTDTGQETPHDEKDMAPDGMDDDSDNNRSMMGEEKEVNPWAICTSSLGLEGRDRDSYTKAESAKFERCVKDVKKQNENHQRTIRQIEESLVNLIRKHIPNTMTKKDLIGLVEQGTKEAPTKTPVKTPSKPDRKTPYKPKHKPAPKAEKAKNRSSVELPSFLNFDNLNIQFRDEKAEDNN